MKENEMITVGNQFVDDPDAFIKMCDSPRKRREREQMVELDEAKQAFASFACEILLAIGIALIIVAIIK